MYEEKKNEIIENELKHKKQDRRMKEKLKVKLNKVNKQFKIKCKHDEDKIKKYESINILNENKEKKN